VAADVGTESGGVAFWAHVAGFLAGVAGVLVLRKPARKQWA
jgi:membrane associated rhomboid family serine protease